MSKSTPFVLLAVLLAMPYPASAEMPSAHASPDTILNMESAVAKLERDIREIEEAGRRKKRERQFLPYLYRTAGQGHIDLCWLWSGPDPGKSRLHGAAAVKALERAIALNPDQGLIWADLGDARRCLNECDAAIVDFKTALRVDPSSAKALFGLGVCFLEQEKPRVAADYLKDFVSQSPDDLGGHYNLTKAYAVSGDLQAARRQCEYVIELGGRTLCLAVEEETGVKFMD